MKHLNIWDRKHLHIYRFWIFHQGSRSRYNFKILLNLIKRFCGKNLLDINYYSKLNIFIRLQTHPNDYSKSFSAAVKLQCHNVWCGVFLTEGWCLCANLISNESSFALSETQKDTLPDVQQFPSHEVASVQCEEKHPNRNDWLEMPNKLDALWLLVGVKLTGNPAK